MIGLDTNILVRLIVADDPIQLRACMRLMQSGRLLILTTVLMETEWVLRSVYKRDRRQILQALEGICGLANIELDYPDDIRRALDLFASGFDFADAFHAVTARRSGATSMATFDEKFRKRMDDNVDLPASRVPA